MTIDVAQSQYSGRSANLTIEVAFEQSHMPAEVLREATLAASRKEGPVTVDFSGVEHLDTAALQVLLSFEREQRNRKLDTHFAGISGNLQKCFQFAGAIESLFQDGAGQQ